MSEKACISCRWLRKYTAENGFWMNVCEAEEPESDEDGLYTVMTVALDEFDPSECLLYSAKEGD